MPVNFTFRRLEYFVVVGEEGSIAGAAEKLKVSPPSISTALVQLEDEFRTQLFVRHHAHGMSLTSGGRRLFHEAKKLLHHADNLRNIAADLSECISGELHIGCLQTVAPVLLPFLRRRFEEDFPEVQIRQWENHHAALLQGLLDAEMDLCITYDYDLALPPDIEFLPLADMPAYVMLAAAHPLAKRPFIVPADLAAQPFILLDLPFSAKYFLSLFERAGVAPTIVARSKDMALVRSMVANGFGYSLGNIRSPFDFAADGEPIVQVPLKGGLRPLRLGLASYRANYEKRAATAFREYCLSMAGKGRLPGVVGDAGAGKRKAAGKR